MWFFEDFKFAYKTTKFYAKWRVQLWTKTRTSISRKISCVKSGFQILHAVDQFRQIKARSTHTPNPWSAFAGHVVGELPSGSQPTALTSAVWNWHLKDLPREERVLYTRVFPGHWPMAMPCWWAPNSWKKTGVHGCHCPRDMAVRMREVMARPWVGVCVPLALLQW